MKHLDISFEDGYFYEGFGINRKTLAYMNADGEISKSSLWSIPLAYFDKKTGGIFEKKGTFGDYYSQIARIEKSGYFYVGDTTTFTNGEIIGKMYNSEVEKIYNYLSVNNEETKNIEDAENNALGIDIKILFNPVAIIAALLVIFSAFGIYGLMADAKFSEYWWHLFLMIGSFLVMLFQSKKTHIDDYFEVYLGYTAITSFVIIILLLLDEASVGEKILTSIATPLILGGSYIIPSIIGALFNKIINHFSNKK